MNDRATPRPAGPAASTPGGTAPAVGGTASVTSSGGLLASGLPGPAGPVAGTGPAAAAGGRPAVIQLVFREKGALYAAYMPLLTDGGLFVPTAREYKLGEDIYLLLSLPDDPQRFPVAGKVAWITPPNASGGRTQGVGVRFPNDDKTRQLKIKIEEILGTSISSAKPTQTL
jgi:type IV pilus assembly protein PilZ